ncbi:MAG TPA: TatD family hydrolase [Candidatus Peribacteraceae bacterium]|nr:TatD family hydrolase [Candidatus Peribacteraceae bacterium]
MIDAHCHLADKQFNNDLDAVLDRALSAGVTKMVTIADSLEEGEQCIEIATKYENVFATVGVHPHNAKHWKKGDGERLRELLQSSKKVKALGEIGLDYHYDHSPRGSQRAVFMEQLSLAKEMGLPAVIHCREAIEDLSSIIREIDPLQVVIHCCSEKWSDVEWMTDRGFFLSFTGIITYPKSHDVRETVQRCPLHLLMVETDSPYLAPVPHRGKRNEPAFVAEVVREIAKVKEIAFKEADDATTANALAFFDIASVSH